LATLTKYKQIYYLEDYNGELYYINKEFERVKEWMEQSVVEENDDVLASLKDRIAEVDGEIRKR
jgi:hypothetical protein